MRKPNLAAGLRNPTAINHPGVALAPNTTELSALSRLFSSAVFREMAKKGRSNLFGRLFRQTGLSHERLAQGTVGAAFDAAFSVLRQSGRRDEYVYRAALTHNILLGTHSLKTASMLTEFRSGTCRADLVILNGTSTVYEIKSERDSLTRLPNQIENYRKLFAKVYVVTSEAHVQQIIGTVPEEVGIMCLIRWDRIRTLREAVERPDLVCPTTIFDSLRSTEARAILRDVGILVPDVPNTALHGAMRQRFSNLDPADVHRRMVTTLKRTRNLAPLGALVSQLPISLQPAALSISVCRVDHSRVVEAILTPLSAALAWG